MRIQHNIMAMNAYRNYTTNTSALSKNLEKLSSGYRINRAGDDAAGLAISEKMRAQITALGTAQKNVKDGISLVKTAEGATQEVHDMLNRMVDLATQSANGTYQDKVDREAIEQEFNALKTEIDRIADASNFNGIKLLDGSMNGVGKTTFTDATVTAVDDGLRGGDPANAGEYTLDLAGLELNLAATGTSLTAGDTAFTINVAGTAIATVSVAISKGEKLTITSGDIKIVANNSATINGLDFTISLDGTKLTLKGMKAAPTTTEADTFNATGLDVTVTNGTDITNNNGWDQSVHTVTAVSPAVSEKLAHGSFDLATANLKDGSVIKIGDETYSFKIGKDGKGASADHEIDLSNVEATDSDFLKKAVEALAKQENKIFDISAPNNDGTIHLNEKKGALADYSEWELQGTTGNATDAAWKNLKTGAAVVQFGSVGEATGKSLTLQIGEDSEKYNQLTLDIQDLHSAALGLDKLTLGNQESAQAAVSKIKDAINVVSTVRSGLGATQNRLEHTANNLSVMKENIQDAESTIRDTDVAEEMMAYTKNNILVQSAQAMLAQANQVPQGVLQLLG